MSVVRLNLPALSKLGCWLAFFAVIGSAVTWCVLVHAQETHEARPRMFLSCATDCFENYLKQELSYFDFTNDPHRANITLVVARQPAGHGGEQFTVSMASTDQGVALKTPVPRDFTVGRGAQPGQIRQHLLQAMLRVLHDGLRGTAHEQVFVFSLPRRDAADLSSLGDPWDYWTFMPQVDLSGEGGSGFYYIEGGAGLTARRITDATKTRLRGTFTRNWNGFKPEGQTLQHGTVSRWEGRGLFAYSLGERWGLGGVGVVRASEYENLKFHVHAGPLLEFNLFPYAENAFAQVRWAYQAGFWWNRYLEPNVKGKSSETRPYHALSLITDANQPWGSIQVAVQGNQFMDAYENVRVSAGAVFTLRLFEGLAVAFEGQGAWVKDQINLRSRVITDRELMLWTAEQATNFTFEGGLTLVYTFGSGHNTVVNPRFARVDLDEE